MEDKLLKEFVPYEEADDLKELGFDEECFIMYHDINEIIRPLYDEGESSVKNSMWDDSRFVAAPLYQQAFRWFREKHNLQHEITRQGDELWLLTIIEIDKTHPTGVFSGARYNLEDDTSEIVTSYPQAELACLKKLIEIIKDN